MFVAPANMGLARPAGPSRKNGTRGAQCQKCQKGPLVGSLADLLALLALRHPGPVWQNRRVRKKLCVPSRLVRVPSWQEARVVPIDRGRHRRTAVPSPPSGLPIPARPSDARQFWQARALDTLTHPRPHLSHLASTIQPSSHPGMPWFDSDRQVTYYHGRPSYDAGVAEDIGCSLCWSVVATLCVRPDIVESLGKLRDWRCIPDDR